MKSQNFKRFDSICFAIGALIGVFIILPTILPLPPNYSIIETYSYMFHNPISYAKQISLPFVYYICIFVSCAVALWVFNKLIKKIYNNTHIDIRNKDFKKIYDLLYEVCRIMLITLIVCSLISIINVKIYEDIGLRFYLWNGLIFCFTLWTLYSLLRCKNGIQLVRGYFVCMVAYIVVNLYITIHQTFTLTSGLSGDEIFYLILFIGILFLFIRGLIISFNKNFVSTFPPNKDISWIQVFIMCLIFFCLIGLSYFDFNFSIPPQSNYPALNPSK